MGKKIDAVFTILCLATTVLLPVLRSGELPQIWERIVSVDMAGLGLKGILGLWILGVQMIPAFWFACLARHYVTNMLILAALALLVIATRKVLQKKTGEVY